MIPQLPHLKPDSLLHAVLRTGGGANNPFLSGGLVLMLVGGVAAWGRRLPSQLWHWLLNRCTITVDILNSDPAFHWISAWLDKHPYARRSRRLSVTTLRDRDGDPSEVLFTPAPGDHFFMYGYRLVWFSRDRKEAGAKPEGGGTQTLSAIPPETYHLRVLGRSQAAVRDLITNARKAHQQREKAFARVYLSQSSYWEQAGPVPDRRLDSVLLPAGQAEDVMADVRWFRENREWYHQRGVPYRRGYLMHGQPGCGKTSLVSAIAAEFGLNIYVLSLSSVASDAGLNSLLNDMGGNALLLLEDIDAAVKGRQLSKGGEDREGRGITLSGLLNALDGISAREGMLVFMTTNYKDRLDPALIRPGRADKHLQFDFANAEQLSSMFLRFFPGDAIRAQQFATAVGPGRVTMAEVQQHMLVHHASGALALAEASDIGKDRSEGAEPCSESDEAAPAVERRARWSWKKVHGSSRPKAIRRSGRLRLL